MKIKKAFATVLIVALLLSFNTLTIAVHADRESITASEVVNYMNSLVGQQNNYQGYCLLFVTKCWETMGFPGSYGWGTAANFANANRVSYSRDNIPVGADVFFTSDDGLGHIGIHVGDGYFVHAGNKSTYEKSNLFTNSYYSNHYDGWGWHPYVTVVTAPTTANMDVNFWVDGKDQVNIDGIGTIQVYVDGKLQATGTDFCQNVVVGKSYEVKVNITNSSYHFAGVDTSASGYSGRTGTTGAGGTNVRLVIVKDTGGSTNIANGNYQIVSVIDNAYGLDVAGDTIPCANSENVALWPIGSTPRPQDCFTLTNLGNGYYSIKQMDTNMMVDVVNGSTNRVGNIQMCASNGSNAQQWKICYDSSLGGYTFQSKCSGMYLTVEGGIMEAGRNVYQNIKSATPKAQVWKLIPYAKEDYTYELIDNNTAVRITKYTGAGGNVTIPSTLGGKPVKEIGADAFFKCTSLTSVTIPNGVISIGEDAFYGCSNLATVYYGGTKADRAHMTIESNGNQPLLNATWVYQEDPGDDPSQPTDPNQTLIYKFTFENGGDTILKKYDDWETMSYTSVGEIVEWPVGSGNHALRYQLNAQTHTGAGLHPYIWPKGIDEILIAQGDLAAGETYELTIDIANTGNTAGSYMYPFLLCNGVYDDENYFDKTSFSPAAAFQTHTFVLSSLVAEPMAGAESGGIAFVDEQTLDDGSYMYIDNVTLVKKGTWKPISAGARATYLDGTPAEMGIVGTASPTSSSEPSVEPSDEPSVEPSNEPSDKPSDEPSDVSDLPGGTGDANGDGSTDMKDVLFARKFIAGMGVDVDEDALDVNRDGSVDMKDVLLMRKFIAGLIDKFPRTTA